MHFFFKYTGNIPQDRPQFFYRQVYTGFSGKQERRKDSSTHALGNHHTIPNQTKKLEKKKEENSKTALSNRTFCFGSNICTIHYSSPEPHGAIEHLKYN